MSIDRNGLLDDDLTTLSAKQKTSINKKNNQGGGWGSQKTAQRSLCVPPPVFSDRKKKKGEIPQALTTIQAQKRRPEQEVFKYLSCLFHIQWTSPQVTACCARLTTVLKTPFARSRTPCIKAGGGSISLPCSLLTQAKRWYSQPLRPYLLLPRVHGQVAEEDRARMVVLAGLGPVHTDVLASHVRAVCGEGLRQVHDRRVERLLFLAPSTVVGTHEVFESR